MLCATRRPTREGTVLPMIGVCLIAIFSFVALAVDLGMLAVARTQCQNAADVAALVACRTLDNKQPDNPGYDNNRPAALQAGTDAIGGSPYMSTTMGSAAVTKTSVVSVKAGVYEYDTNPASQTYQTFVVSYPSAPPAGRSWTAVDVNVTVAQPTYFARLWGVNSMPSGARAVAVYRPRDVAFVLDMTGSMAYASTFNYSGTHLNADPLAPGFGHYTSIQSKIVATKNESNSSGEAISRNNFTMTTPGGTPIVRDFYYTPDNVADPSKTTTLPEDRSKLRSAFHAWSPSESPGDPTNYVSQTYSFTGYDAFSPRDAANPKGPTPAPDNFKTMTDSGAIVYVGDRWRRADGSINKTNTSWSTSSAATRGAGTAIELLGYNVSSGNVRGGTSGGSTIAAEGQFRDPTWERHGYDLDIVQYRADRGTGAPKLPAGSPENGTYTAPLVAATDKFQGYSMGPGYWGKTFFIWPPDPRAPVGDPGTAGSVAGDWRRRFLSKMGTVTATKSGSTTTVNYGPVGAFDPQGDSNPYNGSSSGSFDSINEVLLNTGSGMTLKSATSSQSISTYNTGTGGTSNTTQTVDSYRINYAAVLKWIKSGPQVLPPNLRAGRVLYYSSIPNDVDTSTGTTQEKLDKRFWKEYIDWVFGYRYTSPNNLAGVADSWSSASQLLTPGDLSQWDGPGDAWGTANNLRPYMRYTDSPIRPRLHFWFGPLSMMDFIANVDGNWNPGTGHEAQCWQLKAGMNSVLDDIRNNHPNDAVGMAMFSYGTGSLYRSARVPMGQNFTPLKNALFFPRSLLGDINGGNQTIEMRPYDSSFGSVAMGEIPNGNGSTDPNTGLMLAYNLLSSSTSLSATEYGTVRGRRGASKIVIFETDGVPNSYCSGALNQLGYNSYYSGFGNGGSPGNGVEPSMSTAVTVAGQITKPMLSSGTTGLSLPNAPARVYPIAFGDLFDPVAAPNATFRATAHQFLSDVGVAGGTLPSGTKTLPSHLVITGSYQNRIANLKTCMERIFQSGVSVSLIE
ncbi:Tad domain-containing protein [bacterium]|nr:Tad domain-containing protein [bacterium]